jgi:H+/Cl- antiporter ClcA
MMSSKVKIGVDRLLVFFCVWYFFTCTTYGTNVPAGLFVPGMVLGSCLGSILSNIAV